MSSIRRKVHHALLLGVAVAASSLAGCSKPDIKRTTFDGSLTSDGRALFKIDPSGIEDEKITFHLTGVAKGETYLLFYSLGPEPSRAPVVLDLERLASCGKNETPECHVDGLGWLVDRRELRGERTTVALGHDACASFYESGVQAKTVELFFSIVRLDRSGSAGVRVRVDAVTHPLDPDTYEIGGTDDMTIEQLALEVPESSLVRPPSR